MDNKMEKRYGLPTAISMVIGIVIGSGIFFKTEAVLHKTGGNAIAGILSIVVMGIVMLVNAYAFSIFSQRYEKVNGLVDYAEATCGRKYAYYMGWFMTFIYTPALNGALAWVTAMYFGGLFGWGVTSGEVLAIAAFILVADGFLNAVAPKLSGKFQVSTTAIKLIPLCLMAIVGTIKGLGNGQLVNSLATVSVSGETNGGFFGAVVSLAFAFEGWILATTINSELKDAKKTLPRALVLGTIVILAIYVLYYLGICGAIPIDELLGSSSTQAFNNTFGNIFGTVLSVFIVVSCYGTTHGLNMASMRNMYALAMRDCGPKPAFFKKVDSETGTPINSALLATLLGVFWMMYYFGCNVAGKWFGVFSFESTELPIVALYAMYIPMMLKMFSFKDEKPFRRYVVPVLAIICCAFLSFCAIYSYGIVELKAALADGGFSCSVLFFIIFFAVVMFIGKFFYKEEKKK